MSKIEVEAWKVLSPSGRAPLKAPLDELVVSMAPGTPVQESAAVISTLLDRLHGGAADYTITVPE